MNFPESLSPRLVWMKNHGITTMPSLCAEEDFWTATARDPLGKHILTVEMPDEDSALVKIAQNLKLKLWNES